MIDRTGIFDAEGPRNKGPSHGRVDWPRAAAMMVSMPALRMRDRDPAEYLGELAIMPRLQKTKPVVGNQAIGGDANLGLSVGLRDADSRLDRRDPQQRGEAGVAWRGLYRNTH
jgi:hypothetical protein